MVVLGVDPSYTATGYAVLSQTLHKQFLVAQGSFSLPSDLELSNRIGLFYENIRSLIVQHQVNVITIETPFLGKNTQVFLKLGYLRGMLHLLAYQYSINIIEYSPCEIKKAITGFGAAEKIQVSNVVRMLFPNLILAKNYDVTDAIAIGLCGLWKR